MHCNFSQADCNLSQADCNLLLKGLLRPNHALNAAAIAVNLSAGNNDAAAAAAQPQAQQRLCSDGALAASNLKYMMRSARAVMIVAGNACALAASNLKGPTAFHPCCVDPCHA
jgi:hypothetical protein